MSANEKILQDTLKAFSKAAERDPTMFLAGYHKGFKAVETDANLDAAHVLDTYPDHFEGLGFDPQTDKGKEQDYVHTIGLFCGYVSAKETTRVQTVEGVAHV